MLITQTPLRVSLAGGPTDLPKYADRHGGEIIGFAIDKYLYVWIKERFDRQIVINYTKKEVVRRVEQIHHDLVREAVRMAGIKDGFDITTSADIPSQGSGLGSSSALTVGLVNAAFQMMGTQLPNLDLAKRASHIEIEILGNPIGRQDQYLAALGGVQHLRFRGGGRVEVLNLRVAPSTIRLLNQNLLLFYTGISRKASPILSEHNRRMRASLRSYHAMKALARAARTALVKGCPDDLGPILHEAWGIKQGLASGVTLPEIDAMYAAAREAGATGGKVCGAGGGGFLLVYCPVARQDDLRRRLHRYAEMPFQIEPDGTKSILNVRRPMWKTRM